MRNYSLNSCLWLLFLVFSSVIAKAQPPCDPPTLPSCVTDMDAYQTVVDYAPSCCFSGWTSDCTDLYNQISSTCYVPSPLGCDALIPPCIAALDQTLLEQVYNLRSECCSTIWDTECQLQLLQFVLLPGNFAVGFCPNNFSNPCNAPVPTCATDQIAIELVIDLHPPCCFSEWDSVCEGLYTSLSTSCLPLPSDCLANVPACVNDIQAWQDVILISPDCCDIAWTISCQNAYDVLSNSCEGVPFECSVMPPACVTDLAALDAVQANDSFCCDTGWDNVCQGAYDELSTSCLGIACSVIPPACVTDLAALSTVQANDSFCCDTGWDTACQTAYNAISTSCSGLACSVTPPACVTDLAALSTVQANDSFCCDTGWDNACQSAYDAISTSCTGGGCTVTPPACVTDLDALAIVVLNDPVCCNQGWDSYCQSAYDALSTSCTGEGCSVIPPACVNDLAALEIVRANDSFCCVTSWDNACQEAYDALSTSCTGGGCAVTPPSCATDLAALQQVIANDPVCCEEVWDAPCQEAYDALSTSCTGEGCPVMPPPCVTDLTALAIVVSNDPVCCSQIWDSYCQEAYDLLSNSCSVPVVPGCIYPLACNFNPEANVDNGICDFNSCAGCTYPDASNYVEFATIDNGSCIFGSSIQCPGDLNGDSLVNASDLGLFLAAFGSFCD